MNLKDHSDNKSGVGPIAAFLTAITLLGIAGLGIMLGGSLALRKEADLAEPVVVLFMLLSFFVVVLTEIMLVRQLSRFTPPKEQKQLTPQQQPVVMPNEFRFREQRTLSEPVPSVTENTTRTLEYATKEPLQR